jgi:non-ribosomal peptide synthetase component E (peptide arylation enzyme)
MNSAAEVERSLHVTGLQLYGMTEGLLTFGRTDDPKQARYETVGRPISEMDKLRIVAPGTEKDLPVGEVGELLVKGPYTIRGFYKAADLDRESFTSDGYYRTGDLMRAKEFDGKLYYAFEGRTKDVIDRGGEKINCQEVERVLMSHPDVVAAALVAMPDRKFGERACAMLTLAENADPLSVATLGTFLEREGLAKYKWPERVEIMEELPVTNINKPDKVRMREIIKELLEGEGRNAG